MQIFGRGLKLGYGCLLLYGLQQKQYQSIDQDGAFMGVVGLDGSCFLLKGTVRREGVEGVYLVVSMSCPSTDLKLRGLRPVVRLNARYIW